MGAWGVGSFDNDDAADWAYELEESEGTDLLEATLDAIDAESYPEAPDCSMALAAAEVVAALRGSPADSLPPEIVSWVDANPIEVDSDLRAKTLMAIHRIETESELKELWEEAGELDSWMASLEDLKGRLGEA